MVAIVGAVALARKEEDPGELEGPQVDGEEEDRQLKRGICLDLLLSASTTAPVAP